MSLVREGGLEPPRPYWTLEPESSESANSTTRAYRSAISYPVAASVIVSKRGDRVKKNRVHSHALFPLFIRSFRPFLDNGMPLL